MGWQDRDYGNENYYESGSSRHGLRRPPNGALTLMILHGVAFLLMAMLRAEEDQAAIPLIKLLDFKASAAAILLHPFATDNLFTALFVVLALWSLGGRLELKLGTRRLVGLYVAGNVVAGGVYLALVRLLPALAGEPLEYPAGALAAMCVAAWSHLKHDAIQVLGRVTTRAKMYAICAAIVVVLEVFRERQAALAWIVAVAAGGVAAPLVEYLVQWIRQRRRRAPRVVRPSRPRSRPRPPTPGEPNIDDILAKISRSGLDSLTDDERKRLEAARHAKLKRRD
ncbi:MAG: rhomboid family intramembrane serine protease [Phycisphaerae bacterium]|nr:rhomboid family intramembrane serine protease [Phycisphaerae bacterium]